MFGNACVYNKKMNPRGCQQSCGSHQGSNMMRVRRDRRDRFSHDSKSRTQDAGLRIQDSGSRTTATGTATTQDPGLAIQDSGPRTLRVGSLHTQWDSIMESFCYSFQKCIGLMELEWLQESFQGVSTTKKNTILQLCIFQRLCKGKMPHGPNTVHQTTKYTYRKVHYFTALNTY